MVVWRSITHLLYTSLHFIFRYISWLFSNGIWFAHEIHVHYGLQFPSISFTSFFKTMTPKKNTNTCSSLIFNPVVVVVVICVDFISSLNECHKSTHFYIYHVMNKHYYCREYRLLKPFGCYWIAFNPTLRLQNICAASFLHKLRLTNANTITSQWNGRKGNA